MTFDEFRATSRFKPEYTPEGYALNEPGPYLIYFGGLLIDLCIDHPKGPFMLVIGNTCEISRDLVKLERRLYDYAVSEHYIIGE